jgi:integration host factor subunit beta
MTKSDLIDVLCETQKLPKGRAELLVHVIFDALEAALKRGERIEIRGFGSFELRSYRGYDGRNPRTGSAVEVRPKRLPFFKVGKELKERVNEGRLAAPRAAAKRAPVAGEAAPINAPVINVAVPTTVTETGPVATDGETTAAAPNARATA